MFAAGPQGGVSTSSPPPGPAAGRAAAGKRPGLGSGWGGALQGEGPARPEATPPRLPCQLGVTWPEGQKTFVPEASSALQWRRERSKAAFLGGGGGGAGHFLLSCRPSVSCSLDPAGAARLRAGGASNLPHGLWQAGWADSGERSLVWGRSAVPGSGGCCWPQGRVCQNLTDCVA